MENVMPKGFTSRFSISPDFPQLIECGDFDGDDVWDEEEEEGEEAAEAGVDDDHHGGSREGAHGRKRKREEDDDEEEGRVVEVVARRMRVKDSRTQVEMTTRATMRKAEALTGAARSGKRPELEGDWQGRKMLLCR